MITQTNCIHKVSNNDRFTFIWTICTFPNNISTTKQNKWMFISCQYRRVKINEKHLGLRQNIIVTLTDKIPLENMYQFTKIIYIFFIIPLHLDQSALTRLGLVTVINMQQLLTCLPMNFVKKAKKCILPERVCNLMMYEIGICLTIFLFKTGSNFMCCIISSLSIQIY